MTGITTSGISGTDGLTPVYDPNGLWKTWALHEIYVGTIGENRYVPNLKDYVVDVETDERWVVEEIDPSTLIPVLRKIVTLKTGEFDDDDLLLGVGPGTQADTYRLYIDKSVLPYTMAVDARLSVKGTMVMTAKIFRGSELLGNSQVISAFYDQLGNMLGQAIPLELVEMPNDQNFSVKTVPVCYTSENLPDNEVVTVVFYSATGHVVSKRQLLVENTAFIRSANTAVKYITGISMESPFISNTDPTLLAYPMNVPLRGLNLMGVVHYSDGTSLKMPVDGTKFSIYGLEQYLSTVIGQRLPLVLKYAVSSDEIVYGATVTDNKFVTKNYRATTVQANGAFTVKLFGYPVWIDGVHGYRLEWYMYNLERNRVFNVTPYVTFNNHSAVFDPTNYGVAQHLNVSLNLKDANGAYPSYIHAQTISISLVRPGTEHQTNWTIAFDPMQSPEYGVDNFAQTEFINQNLSKIKIDSGALTQTAWLDKLYFATKPLVDDAREVTAPVPNYYTLVVGNVELEYPIGQWNSEQLIETSIANGSTVFVKFFKRTPEGDIQLSVAGLPVYQSN